MTFWKGRPHEDHIDAPGWLILVLMLLPALLVVVVTVLLI